MASAFGHGYSGVMLGSILYWRSMPIRFWLASALLAILPDIDAIGFFLGIPYGSTFGHRGFTHSILFALLAGFAAAYWIELYHRGSRMWWLLAAYFFLVVLSHPILDAMTTGGLGVAFFSPFSNERYFFPWRVIQVSPIGVGSFFSEWGRRVMLSEAQWIGLPLLFVWLIIYTIRRIRS
jgi:inner membrane protein